MSIYLLQHSNFQASKLLINVPLQGYRVPCRNCGVPGSLSPGGPRVPGSVDHIEVLGLGSHLGSPGLASQSSGMPIVYCNFMKCYSS